MQPSMKVSGGGVQAIIGVRTMTRTTSESNDNLFECESNKD